MRRAWAAAALALGLLALAPGTGAALEVRQGERVHVPRGQAIRDDVVAAGELVVVDGTVEGDLIAFARRVVVNGTVRGDLLGAAEEVRVAGTVTGDVRVAAREVDVEGTLGGSLMTAAETARVGAGARVGGSWLAAAARLRLEGAVARGVHAAADDAYLAGRVGRDARLWTSRLRVAPGARLEGRLVYTSRQEAAIDPRAQIAGGVTRHEPPTRPERPGPGDRWHLLRAVGFAASGWALLALAPAARTRIPERLRRQPLRSLLLGAGLLFGLPLAALLLALTGIGLPLGAFTLLALPLAVYLGQVPVALAVGQALVARIPPAARWRWPAAFLTGVALTTLLTRLPHVGGWLAFLSACAGLACAAYGVTGAVGPGAPADGEGPTHQA